MHISLCAAAGGCVFEPVLRRPFNEGATHVTNTSMPPMCADPFISGPELGAPVTSGVNPGVIICEQSVSACIFIQKTSNHYRTSPTGSEKFLALPHALYGLARNSIECLLTDSQEIFCLR